MRAPTLATVMLAAALTAAYADDTSVRSVAVASQFDNTFHKQRIARFASNTDETKDVGAWDIPGLSETQLIGMIQSQHTDWKVAALQQPDGRYGPSGGTDAEQATLIAKARDAGFDTLVLIQPAQSYTFSDYPAGYGIAGIRAIVSFHTCPFALFRLVTYRTADAKRIDWEWGYKSMQMFTGEGPCQGLDIVPWHDNIADYSDAEWKMIEGEVKRLITEDLTRALSDLRFQ